MDQFQSDPIALIAQQTFIGGLKGLTRAEWEKCPELLAHALEITKECLKKRNLYPQQDWVPSFMAQALIDNSITTRPEAQITNRSNKDLAMIGSHVILLSTLSLHFVQNGVISTADAHASTKLHAVIMYDKIFGVDNHVILGWDSKPTLLASPSSKQKSDCIEALVGYMFVTGQRQIAFDMYPNIY